MQRLPRIPLVKIGFSSLCEFEYIDFPRRRKDDQNDNSLNNLRKDHYSHFGISSQANIKKTVNNWITTQHFASTQLHCKNSKEPSKHTFTTLTLPAAQMHCDKVIKREVLNHFIINMVRRWKIRNYLWKAEAQSNGNIHFHLLTDQYMAHEQLKHMWNRATHRLGYIDFFAMEHGHSEPNSTDIHALKTVNNVTSYVCKYVAKPEQGRIICGHSWYASDNVKKLKPITIEVSTKVWDWLNEVQSMEGSLLKPSDNFCLTMTGRPIDLKSAPREVTRQVREICKHNLKALCTS